MPFPQDKGLSLAPGYATSIGMRKVGRLYIYQGVSLQRYCLNTQGSRLQNFRDPGIRIQGSRAPEIQGTGDPRLQRSRDPGLQGSRAPGLHGSGLWAPGSGLLLKMVSHE